MAPLLARRDRAAWTTGRTGCGGGEGGGSTARERMARRILDAIAAERLAGAGVFEEGIREQMRLRGRRPAGRAGCPERPAGAGADMEHAGPSAALRRSGAAALRRPLHDPADLRIAGALARRILAHGARRADRSAGRHLQ